VTSGCFVVLCVPSSRNWREATLCSPKCGSPSYGRLNSELNGSERSVEGTWENVYAGTCREFRNVRSPVIFNGGGFTNQARSGS